jgi:hypothetical protein
MMIKWPRSITLKEDLFSTWCVPHEGASEFLDPSTSGHLKRLQLDVEEH